jgi:hypothetical protein
VGLCERILVAIVAMYLYKDNIDIDVAAKDRGSQMGLHNNKELNSYNQRWMGMDLDK